MAFVDLLERNRFRLASALRGGTTGAVGEKDATEGLQIRSRGGVDGTVTAIE